MKKRPPTTKELIRTEIDRLHARQSGDWQSLIRQVDHAYRPIEYNLAQWFAVNVPRSVKELDLEWGRGTGKTTVAAHFTREIVQDLPRGAWQWEVPTYQKFLTEIIPAYIHSLEMQGLYKDLHYFIGRRAPASWGWPEPYKPPLKYDHAIIFYNGFLINLLSQDIPGAGRGLSTDGRFADEAVMLDKKKLDEESGPSIRGSNIREFGNRRWFDFRLHSSSTALTLEGEWFINRQQLAEEDPERHRFLRANCLCNLPNLKPNYLEVERKNVAEQWVFDAEYLNIRPRLTRGGFYSLLNEERHTYTQFNYTGHYIELGAAHDCRGDDDLAPTEPLILGVDWGAAINSMVVLQHVRSEIRALKNLFTLGMEGESQDDLFAKFHRYYQHHAVREVWLYYDQTGNVHTGNTKLTRARQAEQQLVSLGWKVRRMTLGGTNPRHGDKYVLWERLLEERDARLPRFRLNRQNCRELWISMSRAKAKRAPDGTVRKDKSGERSDNPQRQYATDLSDAVDQPVFSMFNQLLRGGGSVLPESSVRSH